MSVMIEELSRRLVYRSNDPEEGEEYEVKMLVYGAKDRFDATWHACHAMPGHAVHNRVTHQPDGAFQVVLTERRPR